MTGVSLLRSAAKRNLMVACGVAWCGTLLFAGAASADFAYPNVTMQFFTGSGSQPVASFNLGEQSDSISQLGQSEYMFQGGTSGNAWSLNWSIAANPEMSGGIAGGGGVYLNLANLSVTNNTMSTQQFMVQVTLALDAPVTPNTFSQGDVATSIQSYVGQGATLQNISSGPMAGAPIYEAFIDGTSVATLMDTPTVLSSSGFGTASDTADFGFPAPIVTGPAMNTISIWLKIEVSAQSVATVIGLYQISPIPAPAALPLLAFGAALVRRRRRN